MLVALMIEGQEGVTWPQWLALARTCEEYRFDALFRSDHYNGLHGDEDRTATDAWAVLAGLAARTTRLRLGTLVSPVTFRHPSVLAKTAATVDHISEGRIEVGLGAGWNEREHAAYGLPFPSLGTRMEQLEEQAEIVVAQWTKDVVNFRGRHYQLEAVRAHPKPFGARPPFIVGGTAQPRTAALAARFADEYNTVFATPDELPGRMRSLDAACEQQGRDPATLRRSMMTGCIVAHNDDELRSRTRTVMGRMGQDGDPDAFLGAQSSRWILGTPDQVRQRLGDLEEAGIERIMLQHLVHDDLEMVELVGEELVSPPPAG